MNITDLTTKINGNQSWLHIQIKTPIQVQAQIQLQIQIQLETQVQMHTPDIRYVEDMTLNQIPDTNMSKNHANIDSRHQIC